MSQDTFLLLLVAGIVLGIIALVIADRKHKDPEPDTKELTFEMYLAYTIIMHEIFEFCPESWAAIKKYSLLTKERIIQEFFKGHQQDEKYDVSEHSIIVVKSILATLEIQASDRGYSAETKRKISDDFWKVKAVHPRTFGKKLFEILQQTVKSGTL